MERQQILEKVYQQVRKRYFPRWDRAGAWSVEDVWDLPSDGRCDTKRRTIFIRSDQIVECDELRLVLIHEICHAFTPNHSEKWCQRINKVALMAGRRGQARLSELLIREALEYYSDRMPKAAEVYELIRRAVHQFPDIEYGELIQRLAFEQGLYRAEFEKKYALCRRKFDQANVESNRFA